MNALSSTIRDLLVKAEASFGSWDAFRYKAKSKEPDETKTVIKHKSYTELKQDSENFLLRWIPWVKRIRILQFLVRRPMRGSLPIWER